MPANNPYTSAADAYGSTAAATDQRALEGKILLKAATKLETLANRLASGENVSIPDIGETLEYNQKLWQLFVNETMNDDHPLPQDIKNNIANIGIFVFKRTHELLIDTHPEKIRALVDINRNIASGLLKAATNAAPPSPGTHTPPAPGKTDNMA